MNIPFSPPDISEKEIELVAQVLRSGWITTGPKTKEFEKRISEYVGTKKTVCLNSATAAMELTLRVLGVGPGDEVIVPAYTYTATCSVVCHVGATPVIVDISPDSYEMPYEELDRYFTEKTKVIMPVDLAGILCDYEKIYECIERNKDKFVPKTPIQKGFGRVVVLSDCAHGFGAKRHEKQAGTIADFTSFSFHAVKNLTTAEGGAVTWRSQPFIDDEELYKEYMNLSLHGQTKDALNKDKLGSWEYDILSPAYKCNMTDLQGAIGLAQLDRYAQMLERRQDIIERYNCALKEFDVELLNHKDDAHCSSGHLYFVRINGIGEAERNAIIETFAAKGIVTNVHYKPLPMLTAYRDMGFDIKDYPNAYAAYKNEITLPLYSKLSDEEVDYIVNAATEILEDYRN